MITCRNKRTNCRKGNVLKTQLRAFDGFLNFCIILCIKTSRDKSWPGPRLEGLVAMVFCSVFRPCTTTRSR